MSKGFDVSKAANELENDLCNNGDVLSAINLLQQIPMQDWNQLVTCINKHEPYLSVGLEIVDGQNGQPVQETLKIANIEGTGGAVPYVEVTRPVQNPSPPKGR